MDNSKESDVDKAAQKLSDDIRNMANYKSLYNEIQVDDNTFFFLLKQIFYCSNVRLFAFQSLVASSAVKKDHFKNTLVDALKSNGLETEIRNTVFHWARSQVGDGDVDRYLFT